MEMTNATYGRSTKGIDVLVKDLKNDLSIFDNSVIDVKYSKIVSAVNMYWSGPDADAFLKKLKEKYDGYCSIIKDCRNNLDKVFATELANFKRQQASIKI